MIRRQGFNPETLERAYKKFLLTMDHPEADRRSSKYFGTIYKNSETGVYYGYAKDPYDKMWKFHLENDLRVHEGEQVLFLNVVVDDEDWQKEPVLFEPTKNPRVFHATWVWPNGRGYENVTLNLMSKYTKEDVRLGRVGRLYTRGSRA